MDNVWHIVRGNIEIIALSINGLIAIITLMYTIITRKMLHLSSQPMLKLKFKDITFTPNIETKINTNNYEKIIGNDTRYALGFSFDVYNVGNSLAQNICVDAKVDFIKRRPMKYKNLPIHYPLYFDLLAPFNNNDEEIKETMISFDNFVCREILKDFVENRNEFIGMPFLPSNYEMRKQKLWFSPRISVNCFYSDLQGNDYLTKYKLHFHMYFDDNDKIMKFNILNIDDSGFGVTKKIHKFLRIYRINGIRNKRYTSFWGKKFEKKSLVIIQKSSEK